MWIKFSRFLIYWANAINLYGPLTLIYIASSNLALKSTLAAQFIIIYIDNISIHSHYWLSIIYLIKRGLNPLLTYHPR